MADPLLGARLDPLELNIETDALCPECGSTINSVTVALHAEGSRAEPPYRKLVVTVKTGPYTLQPCGHHLDQAERGSRED